MSDNTRSLIESMVIADSAGANLSDHRAIIGHLKPCNIVLQYHKWTDGINEVTTNEAFSLSVRSEVGLLPEPNGPTE